MTSDAPDPSLVPTDKKSTKDSLEHSDIDSKRTPDSVSSGAQEITATDQGSQKQRPREYGGQAGPEPTRYGDWEKKGRCTDF